MARRSLTPIARAPYRAQQLQPLSLALESRASGIETLDPGDGPSGGWGNPNNQPPTWAPTWARYVTRPKPGTAVDYDPITIILIDNHSNIQRSQTDRSWDRLMDRSIDRRASVLEVGVWARGSHVTPTPGAPPRSPWPPRTRAPSGGSG
eukprot:scaffold1034_cov418-Prasinococcus_capsulatus_cf.AAC.5